MAITVVPVGGEPGAAGHRDTEGAWTGVRGVDDDGAVLVRPDQHVAWRSVRGSRRADHELGEALDTVLGRSGAANGGC
ncbi:hypothetical protein ACFUCP_35850 [Streptomyces olivaceus]|uniref:aromatic-ring hydroxylase C-terminal domain-containing protein n=1 Tax=Streptomyces olivaceus TaxID=47716 RepID=UPI003639484A